MTRTAKRGKKIRVTQVRTNFRNHLLWGNRINWHTVYGEAAGKAFYKTPNEINKFVEVASEKRTNECISIIESLKEHLRENATKRMVNSLIEEIKIIPDIGKKVNKEVLRKLIKEKMVSDNESVDWVKVSSILALGKKVMKKVLQD